ncbi:hypothetical protein NW762_008123 [Fusarium torreyae]|uniref:Uracil permease n=1 Tax=Fusarium torreyae TaxID=1237075 RepID=A0A9W8RYC3_9HYPO|nr:hypothetical protein NW762_008123 [Fusarium torreyae]
MSRLTSWLEVQREGDADVEIYVNKDTRPLPPSRRPYGPWEFVGLWMITGSFNVGGWATGSSLISLGLNVWAIRVFLSFVWTSTNTWYGSQCLKVLLTCIWPSFTDFNTELANGTMQVGDMVAFVLYLVLCLPLIWLSPEHYRKPFFIASTTVATTVFALLIWSTVRARGGGALLADVSGVSGIAPAKSGRLGWAFVAAVTANIGGIATHMWSQSDYTRYARKPGDQILAQLVMVPLGTIVVGCIGIVCTSCAATLYPEKEGLLWQPYVFLDTIREQENNRGARAGVAFASIAFMFSQFGMVVASNLVVAGIDLAALLPRWFTIRRGAYSTLLCAFIMQPWSLLNSATSFLTVVGSFNVFLGPLMGIMFADYFIIRKRTIKLSDLYGNSQESIYWYTKGWNWRAAVAWVLGVWFLLPGLAQRGMDPSGFWGGWTRLYQIGWFAGCFVSGLTFLCLDYFWPIPDKFAVDDVDYFGTFGDVPVLRGIEEKSSFTKELQNDKSAIDEKATEV